jgi:chromate reductase, NAD(P)H dehydrogenase (quinone)
VVTDDPPRESPPRIIAFAGSLRKNSFNHQLAVNLANGAQDAGAEVRVLSLADYPLPVYNADIYDSVAGDPHALFDRGERVGGQHRIPMPDGLLAIKEHFRWADGWVVATPEHNRTFTAALHNLVDWLTRLAPGESPLDNFTYKAVGLASAAYAGGGVTAVADLRRLLSGLGCIVVPGGPVVTIASHEQMFDTEGHLRDPHERREAERVGRRVARMAVQGLTGHH